MDILTIIGSVCIVGIMIAVFVGVLVLGAWRKGMLKNLKIGGIVMPKKKFENDEEEEEVVRGREVEEEVEEKPKASATPFCTVMIDGGKAYQGHFIGADSEYVYIRTEKTPQIAIRKAKLVLIAFSELPQAGQPPQKREKKSEEIESIGEF